MYYLVECTGEYDDYREEAIEFSENEEYLQSKADAYNNLVNKYKVLQSKARIYLDAFQVRAALEESNCALTPFIEKPKIPPKTKQDHAKFARIKEQNDMIRQHNNQKLFVFRKQLAEKFIEDEIPDTMKNLFSVSEYGGFLEIRNLDDLEYEVKETIKPSIKELM